MGEWTDFQEINRRLERLSAAARVAADGDDLAAKDEALRELAGAVDEQLAYWPGAGERWSEQIADILARRASRKR